MSKDDTQPTPIAGQSDPLDRGTKKGASGGALTNSDFVPSHDSDPREDDQPHEKREPRILDDELLKPPSQRSPLK